MRAGTGREKKCHRSPGVSLQTRAPRSAGRLPSPPTVNSVPPRWSPGLCPSRVPVPRHPREKQRPGGTEVARGAPVREQRLPAPPCAGTTRPPALPPGRAGQGWAHRKDRGAGPHRTGYRRLRGAGSRRARVAPAAAHPRPAALPGGGRLAGRGDGEPEHGLPFIPPPPPRLSRPPLPGSSEATTDPAARLPRPYRGAQGCAPSAGRLQPPSRRPGSCSFFGEAGKRERKRGGREGGGKGLRSREKEVCKGRKWRRPRPVREINGNQSPGSQQRNLLPQRSPARAAAPPRPGHRSPGQRSAPAPAPRRGGRRPLPTAPNPGAGQAGGRGARPPGPRGDAMGRGGRGGEKRVPRPTIFLLLWRSEFFIFILKATSAGLLSPRSRLRGGREGGR